MPPITPCVPTVSIVKVRANDGTRTRVPALARQNTGPLYYVRGADEGSACFLHPIKLFRRLRRAGTAGLEPAAFRLTAGCSTS